MIGYNNYKTHLKTLGLIHNDCYPVSIISEGAVGVKYTAGSVHKSMGDNVVRIWVQLKRWCV